jgi:hypothetical protein
VPRSERVFGEKCKGNKKDEIATTKKEAIKKWDWGGGAQSQIRRCTFILKRKKINSSF